MIAWKTVMSTRKCSPMPLPVRMDGEIRRIEFTDNKARLAGYTSADIQIDPYLHVLRKLTIVPTCEERRAEEAAAAAAE